MTSSFRGRIALFLVLTTAFSAVFWALAIGTGHHAGGHGFYAIGVMWCPAAAALLTCRLTGLPVESLGWRWGTGRYQKLAWALPLLCVTIAYTIVWTTGLGGVPDAAFVEKTRQSLAWPHAPDWLVIGGWFAFVATLGVLTTCANTLGEEIGWRGFLAPQLTARFGFGGGVLLTGVIWAAWHMPLLLFADYNADTPWWYTMIWFAVGIISFCVVMNWLRLKSGSLWPAVIMHASHNSFVQGFFTPLTASKGPITAYAIDEFGFVLPLIYVVLAVIFWRKRSEVSTLAV